MNVYWFYPNCPLFHSWAAQSMKAPCVLFSARNNVLMLEDKRANGSGRPYIRSHGLESRWNWPCLGFTGFSCVVLLELHWSRHHKTWSPALATWLLFIWMIPSGKGQLPLKGAKWIVDLVSQQFEKPEIWVGSPAEPFLGLYLGTGLEGFGGLLEPDFSSVLTLPTLQPFWLVGLPSWFSLFWEVCLFYVLTYIYRTLIPKKDLRL